MESLMKVENDKLIIIEKLINQLSKLIKDKIIIEFEKDTDKKLKYGLIIKKKEENNYSINVEYLHVIYNDNHVWDRYYPGKTIVQIYEDRERFRNNIDMIIIKLQEELIGVL